MTAKSADIGLTGASVRASTTQPLKANPYGSRLVLSPLDLIGE